MPIPQVTDRIKEAPAVVLRAVFAGIGQVLMAVDKIRAQMEQATSPAEADQKSPAEADQKAPGAEQPTHAPAKPEPSAVVYALAEDQKSAAIGVILSGTASDGTAGLQAIKS